MRIYHLTFVPFVSSNSIFPPLLLLLLLPLQIIRIPFDLHILNAFSVICDDDNCGGAISPYLSSNVGKECIFILILTFQLRIKMSQMGEKRCQKDGAKQKRS